MPLRAGLPSLDAGVLSDLAGVVFAAGVGVVFFSGDFAAGAFFVVFFDDAGVFLVTAFLAVDFFAVTFLDVDFEADFAVGGFFVVVFLLAAFFAVVFFEAVFFAAVVLLVAELAAFLEVRLAAFFVAGFFFATWLSRAVLCVMGRVTPHLSCMTGLRRGQQ